MSAQIYLIGQPGSGLDLYTASFTFGCGADDDVFLEGEGVLESHLRAIYIDNTLSLQSATGSVWVDGARVSGFPYTVSPTQVLSLGPDTHLYFASGCVDEPDIPVLEMPEEPKTDKAAESKGPAVNYRPAIIGAIATVVIGGAAIVGGDALLSSFFTTTVAATPVASPKVLDHGKFITQVLGDSLLSIEENDAGFTVRARVNRHQALQTEDISRLRLADGKKVTLTWVDPAQITFHVKQFFQQNQSTKGLSVVSDDLKFTVSGVCVASECAAATRLINEANAKFSDALITANIAQIHPDFEFVSMSLSMRAASVTLRRGGVVSTISEGGNVYGMGRLQLISPQGITIATPQGSAFIAWGRS